MVERHKTVTRKQEKEHGSLAYSPPKTDKMHTHTSLSSKFLYQGKVNSLKNMSYKGRYLQLVREVLSITAFH